MAAYPRLPINGNGGACVAAADLCACNTGLADCHIQARPHTSHGPSYPDGLRAAEFCGRLRDLFNPFRMLHTPAYNSSACSGGQIFTEPG